MKFYMVLFIVMAVVLVNQVSAQEENYGTCDIAQCVKPCEQSGGALHCYKKKIDKYTGELIDMCKCTCDWPCGPPNWDAPKKSE